MGGLGSISEGYLLSGGGTYIWTHECFGLHLFGLGGNAFTDVAQLLEGAGQR